MELLRISRSESASLSQRRILECHGNVVHGCALLRLSTRSRIRVHTAIVGRLGSGTRSCGLGVRRWLCGARVWRWLIWSVRRLIRVRERRALIWRLHDYSMTKERPNITLTRRSAERALRITLPPRLYRKRPHRAVEVQRILTTRALDNHLERNDEAFGKDPVHVPRNGLSPLYPSCWNP